MDEKCTCGDLFLHAISSVQRAVTFEHPDIGTKREDLHYNVVKPFSSIKLSYICVKLPIYCYRILKLNFCMSVSVGCDLSDSDKSDRYQSSIRLKAIVIYYDQTTHIANNCGRIPVAVTSPVTQNIRAGLPACFDAAMSGGPTWPPTTWVPRTAWSRRLALRSAQLRNFARLAEPECRERRAAVPRASRVARLYCGPEYPQRLGGSSRYGPPFRA